MASMERIEAERTVDRLGHDAESQWLRGGSRSGALSDVTIDVLKETLVEALADVEPLRKLIKEVKEDATAMLDGMRESDLVKRMRSNAEEAGEKGEEIINAHDVVKGSRPETLAGHLLELLEATVRFYSSRSVSTETPAILQPSLVTLPPRTKRQRTGSTTAWLPFLFDHLAGENVAVNDPLPSSLAPVVTEKKKRTKAEKKAA